MTVSARGSLEDCDPTALTLLRLAAEALLAYPAVLPPGLYDLVDDWAGELHAAIAACDDPGAMEPPVTPGTGGKDQATAGQSRELVAADGQAQRS